MLTTQYLEEADQLADRIAVIDHGRVIAEGTGNELKDRVGGQILEVELTSAGQRDEAQSVLARVGCGDPEPGERPDQLTLPAPRDGLELIEDAAAALRHAGIGVSDLGLRRPDARRRVPAAHGRAAERGRRRPGRVRERGPPADGASPASGPPRVTAACGCTVPRCAELRSAVADARRGHRAQPAPLHSPAPAADLLDDPADHVRAAVRLRVRRRGGGLAPGRGGRTSTSCCPASSCSRWPSARRRPPSACPRTSSAASSTASARCRWHARRCWSAAPSADLVRNVLIIVLMTAVGYLIGFQLPRRAR